MERQTHHHMKPYTCVISFQVLQDVPLPATELEVCRAVQQWALSYYGDDLDESIADMPPPEELIIPNEEDRTVLDHIDLTCVKSIDIKTVRSICVYVRIWFSLCGLLQI